MIKGKYINILTIGAITISTIPISATTLYSVIDSSQKEQIDELKNSIYKLFNTRYTTNKVLINDSNNLDKVAYQIQISDSIDNIENAKYIRNYDDFEKEFDKKYSSLKYNEKIVVRYSTISRKLKNNEVVDYKEQKYKGNESHVIWKTLEDGTKTGKIPITPDIETKESRFIYVNIGDTLLDIDKTIFRQKNGYYIDYNGHAIKKVDKNIIETISTLPNGVIDGYYEDTSIPLTEDDKIVNTDAIVKRADKIITENLTVNDIYELDSKRLTPKGNELLKGINKIIESGLSDYKIRLEGVNKITDDPREIYIDKSDNSNIVVRYIDDNIEVNTSDLSSINIIVEEKTKNNEYIINKLVIKPSRNNGLNNLLDVIINGSEVKTYAGTNRYKTAVEVSKNTYDKANNIVLVSGDDSSLVDGLASTPFAASLDAPILLTKKDTIPTEVIDEIERLEAKNVYIVGGESVVSEEVQLKLEKYYGKNVKRIYGKDRYETSLEVAKEIVKENNTKVDTFIVGGNGEADALSISPVAGNKLSPIILTKKDELSYDTKYFLSKNTNKAYIVGGTSLISNKIDQEIVDINLKVKRLSGTNRQDTNALVIDEFYGNSKELGNNESIIISKSDNEGLVDFLAGGVLGAKINTPILLTTDKLTEKQEDVLYSLNPKKSKIQVGYGINSKILEFINSLK